MAIVVNDDFPKELPVFEGTKNYKFEFTSSRTFQVLTDSAFDNEETVLTYLQSNLNLYIGVPHPNTAFAYCTDLSWKLVNQAGSGERIWNVTYHYGPFPYEKLEKNPLSQPYTIDWDTVEAEEALHRDYTGDTWAARKLIQTTALIPFDPPLTRPITYSVLRIVRNEAINTYDESLIQNYRWTVNGADWDVWIPTSGTTSPSYITIPARCALCVSIKPNRVFSQVLQDINNDATQGYYLEVEYVYHLKFESWGQEDPDSSKWNTDDIGQGWDKRILNKGYQYRDGSGNLKRALDQLGNPTSDTVFLDKNGAVTTTPSYRTFQVYPRQTFGDFGFVPA